jgi:hypothetical protein
MDFRTCPACQASILEDDVDDCPFCGASLSGKSAKPKATPPAATKPAATKPTSKPAATTSKAAPTKPSTTSRKTESDDEDEDADPFEVDTSAVRDAHPISPKRTKTTPMPVTCPMCETSGFISPKLAGKEVKCCNPDCMVPVFKAPPLPKKEEVVVEAPQGMSLASKITMGVMGLLVLIGAGIAYSIMTGEDETGSDSAGPQIPVVVDPDGTDEPEVDDNESPVEPSGPKYAFEFLERESLAELALQAQRPANDNGSPLLGRQMVAEIQFILGNEPAARDTLRQLRAAARDRKYFEAAPLAELAWHYFKIDDEAAANGVLDEALTSVANLPAVGRQSLDDATLLAAAFCRAERWDDAIALVRAQRTLEPRGRTSALWRGALEFHTFDVAAEFERPYLMNMPDSLSVAITRTLCARGAWDEAWTWTTKVDGEDVRHNCQAAWAGALTIVAYRTGDEALRARIDPALALAEPLGQSRMWSAVGDGHLLFDENAEAETALSKAAGLLAEIPLPTPVEVPSSRAIHDSKGRPFAGLHDPVPQRAIALAWADVGNLYARLGDSEAGWSAHASALDALRGMTPGPRATQALVDECTNQENQVKSRLSADGVSDPNRTGFYQYRGQCEQLDALADQRFNEQVALLSRAVDLGLLDDAWSHLRERESPELPLSQQEPWFTSTVPGRIFMVASRADNQTIIAELRSTITPPPRPTPLDDLDYYRLAVTAQTTDQQIDQLGDRFSEQYDNLAMDDDVLDARYLAVVATIFRTHGLVDAFDFAGNAWTKRTSVVEDAFRLLSGLAIVSGHQDELWDTYLRERGKLSVTEKIAIFRGIIDGIIVVRQTGPPVETVEE